MDIPMDITEYIKLNKKLYSYLNEYIESDENNDQESENLCSFINNQKILQNKDQFKEFFQIIVKLSINHNRRNNFIDKIENIILYYKNEISQTFSNTEIFNLFKQDRKLLLFLFENNMFTFDSSIIHQILIKNCPKDNRYMSYFYPEIKKFLKKETVSRIEKELLEIDPNIFDNFEEKRRNGESHSTIAKLIQNDSVDEFIIYVTKNNISSNSKICFSIFETNSFLIKKRPTLIEYAAFYGACQIIRYLSFNGSELPSSLWLFVIHSKNPELIHFLEENSIEPPENDYEICLKEAIKCHHNDFADYIQSNLMNENIDSEDLYINMTYYGFKYHNYAYLQNDLDDLNLLYFSCCYNYIDIVKILYNKPNFDQTAALTINDISSNLFYVTPLHVAAYKNNMDIVYFLLNNPIEIDLHDCEKLVQVIIPSSVKSICKKAFCSCYSLKSITIPDSVTEIGEKAFQSCISLIKIDLPSSITTIPRNCFEWCLKLIQIKLPDNLSKIESFAFHRCIKLTQIEIPSSVVFIGEEVFHDCKSLERVKLSSQITEIKSLTFGLCYSLKEITIPSNIKKIEYKAFNECTSLKKVIFESPSSLIKIQNHAFFLCKDLEEVFIPSTVTSIGTNAFDGCKSLKTVILPSLINEIPQYSFNNCSSLEEILIPSSVKQIRKYAFNRCKSLHKITFESPSSLAEISYHAFYDCISLQCILFPPSAIILESKAFGNCNSLTKADIPISIVDLDDDAFDGCPLLKRKKDQQENRSCNIS